MNEPCIRRTLRDGDVDAIAALHDRVYRPEYGTNEAFVAGVARTLTNASALGWPAGGGVWLVERGAELCGSLGLVAEGGGLGRVRWLVFDPSVRGLGLGRGLLGELLQRAREQQMTQLVLDTFSELTVAARLYRSVGFEVVAESPRDDWGTPMTYQRYELRLGSPGAIAERRDPALPRLG
ncbi:MAG: GNAT family N-acetyltransferase [Solirubrobacteraceae bacterium]